jgi:hypothetical protein
MNYKISESGCWEFQGALLPNGYGKKWHNKKCWLAHRLAYYKKYGAIPADMHVCHKCDNRKCINPDHLFLGTRLDNMRDMIAKGRANFSGLRTNGAVEKAAAVNKSRTNEKSANCKHGNETINMIRQLFANGITQKKLAEMTGIRQGYISKIVNNIHRAL